jgi:hypothetical protein
MKKNILKVSIISIFICAIVLNFSLSNNPKNNEFDRITLEGQKAQAFEVCEMLYFDVFVCCIDGGTTCNALGYQMNGPFYY